MSHAGPDGVLKANVKYIWSVSTSEKVVGD